MLSRRIILRDVEKKQIQVVPRVKQYGLVFDKGVVDVVTKTSHKRIGDEVNLLFNLQI